METPCWAPPQTSSEVRGCAALSAAECVRAEACILEEAMRYQFNFEVEPFAAYAEPAHFRTNSGFNREVFFPSSNGESEEEYGFQGKVTVELKWQPQSVSLAKFMAQSANNSGLYVILVNGNPWYVGKAEAGFRNRFNDRLKTLRDFNMRLEDLITYLSSSDKKITVNWALPPTLRGGAGFKWRRKNKKNNKITKSLNEEDKAKGLLLILEMYYIWKLQTVGRGNDEKGIEPVIIVPSRTVPSKIDIEETKGICRSLSINQGFDPKQKTPVPHWWVALI
jgi:hypothetical protein